LLAATIRLAIVDDHPVLLKGLAALISAEQRYTVVATATTADQAVILAEDMRPDVMILDLSMPGDVFVAMETITTKVPRIKPVVFTAYANVDLALRAFFAGARAFVIKGQPADELFEAIDSVAAGELFVSPQFTPRLLRGFRNLAKRAPESAADFDAREQQLLGALERGQAVTEIAAGLECTAKVAGHYLAFLRRRRQRAVAS